MRAATGRDFCGLAHYTKGNENFLLVAKLEGCQGLVDCNRSKTEYEDEFEYEDD